MFVRSPSPASAATGSVSLDEGRLSPVRAASAVCSAVEWISRASAGIVSPSSIAMMSPGTSSAAGTRRRSPFRSAVASAADMARNFASEASARDSWT